MMGYFLETLEILCHGSEITVAVAYMYIYSELDDTPCCFFYPDM